MSLSSRRKRAAATRAALPGFPIEEGFIDPQDVRDYLGGETIVCLRCGKKYKALGLHILVHDGWNEETYRLHYGLPWRTGLSCVPSRKLKRAIGLDLAERGVAFGGKPGLEWRRAAKAKRRRAAPFVGIVKARNGIRKYETLERPGRVVDGRWVIWVHEDYMKVPQRMVAENRTLEDVCDDEDMPGLTNFYRHSRGNDECAKAAKVAWDALSFTVQAKAEMLGERFRVEATKLRNTGLTYSQVGARLGVSTMTAFRQVTRKKVAAL